MKIGFIGTGVMGSHMALHLAKAHEVHVYNRTPSKAERLSPPCIFHEQLGPWLGECDLIITIVGYPSDVESVFDKLFKYAKEDSILMDMTTSSPQLAIRLFEEGKKKGLRVLDAPVTGGDVGAKDGTLSIMVGGNKEDYKKVLPALELMGKTIHYMGKAGNGQRMKLANQAAIAGTLAGVSEAVSYGMENELDLDQLLNILQTGSASSWQAIKNGRKMVDKDYEPGFYIKHFLKDLDLLVSSSMLDLSIARRVKTMLATLVERGHGDLGTQALILYYIDQVVK